MQPRHPDERAFQLEWRHVLELQEVFAGMAPEAEYTVRDDFIVYPIYRPEGASSVEPHQAYAKDLDVGALFEFLREGERR